MISVVANTDAARHWEAAYRAGAPDQVSWFEEAPAASLGLIERSGVARETAIVDVGGGASRLAGELLARGFTDITVADLSASALATARTDLGGDAEAISWVECDVREHDFGRRFDLWHDRAVLHFMVTEDDRLAYLAGLRRALRPGGFVVLATFGPDGPTSCSGLPVERYGAERVNELLGEEFELIEDELRIHSTPRGGEQQFLHALLRRADDALSPG